MTVHNPIDLLTRYLTDGGISRVDSHFEANVSAQASQTRGSEGQDNFLKGFQNSVQSSAMNWNPQAAAKGFSSTSPMGTTAPSGELPSDALSAQAFAGVAVRLIPDLITGQVYRALAAMDQQPLDPDAVGSVMRLMADLAMSRIKNKKLK